MLFPINGKGEMMKKYFLLFLAALCSTSLYAQ